MKIEKKIRKRYDRKEPPQDYLKYWRVIRYWVKSCLWFNNTRS